MTHYQVQAQNFSTQHENKIHSDAMAKRYGFAGALVPGVAVYGHLTYPLVKTQGPDWLSHATVELKLRKPAYDGDLLDIELTGSPNAQQQVQCHARNLLLADITSQPLTAGQRANPPNALLDTEPKDPNRPTIAWNNLVPNQPFRSWNWHAGAVENESYCDQIRDGQSIYRNYVHPHWILSQANRALTREYLMPTWIHVGSRIHHYAPVMVGDDLVVQVLPTQKWRNKGHEFIKIYVAYRRGNLVTTEIEHTAIFQVAT